VRRAEPDEHAWVAGHRVDDEIAIRGQCVEAGHGVSRRANARQEPVDEVGQPFKCRRVRIE
jgi:hypothetical protein